MAVLSRLDIEISANSARFQQEIQNVSTTSRRAAAQLQREQQQQAQSRLQIERQYASEHRRIEMALTDEVERIRAARFNTADEQRYIAQARANAQQQVDLIAQQERATTGFADKAKAAYGYVAIAIGVASAAIGALIKNQIEMTAELTKTAYIANTTVENIQKYVVAAKGMGIETDKLGDIFKDTQDKVGDFLTTGGGEMADFFENIAPQVKVTADQFRNLSGPDALQLYFDSLQKANLSQSEMIFYMESVADEASALIPYLKDGGKGFDLWATAAENAGATMDEKTIRATQELKTSTELLDLSVQGAKNQIAQAFMPVLRDLAVELVKDAKLKEQSAKAGQGMADGFKLIANTGIAAVSIIGIMIDGVRGLHTAFSELGKITDGVDFKSPFATLQLAKNAFFTPVRMGADVAFTAVQIQQRIDATNGLMEKVNKLGTNPTGSNLVSTLTNLNIQSEKLKNSTGKTGKALKDEAEAKEKNAKATAKLANEQARLVGISGNSGIGSGAHLDIRASGGGRRLTSAELARFQADGKPLTAYRKTSDYGYRGDIGVTGASKYHRGIDFAMPVGTPITTKVAIKDIKSFYDSKGGGYVQRVLFADGLSVDLLHQSPASKGIKGGSSGIKSPYTRAQDETSQLIAQQQAEAAKDAQQQAKEAERAAKEQLDLQEKLKAEYANEDAKRTIEHQNKLKEIAKVNNAKLQRELIIQENARFKNANEKAQLEYDVKFQRATEWQQTEEERIKNNAEIERRETRLTVGLHKDLVTARINEINAKEQETLRQLRAGFESELAGITDYSKSELERIRQEGQKQINALANRKDLNPSQKDEMAAAIKGRTETEAQRVQREAATGFNNLNATMSGTSEWQSLQDQYVARQQIVDNALKAEVISKQQHKDAMLAIDKAYANDSNLLAMAQGQQILGSVTSSLKATLGEHNKAYRVMFAVEKGVNIARSLMAINTGIAMAAANPFPMNLGAMVSVAAATASIVNDIMAIKNPVGQAHDGIMSVPESGTWNLQKGERVLPEHTAKRLDRTLDDVSKKGNGGGNVNIVFENHTSATISQAPSKDGEMRFIIRDEIDNYVPQQLSRTNSAISQALLQNTTATRRV